MASNSNVDWTLQGLDNPDVIQHKLLERFEKDSNTVIVDNNNPACVLMEAFASMSAAQLRMMDDNVRPAIYAARAVTTVDLLKHFSDYDYVDIFSTPCTATITLIVEKNYIMTHSVEVEGKNYRKLIIPKSTQITIGDHTFGLYYPIEIRSNIQSGQFSVMYDTSRTNPLKSLDTNVLDFDFREFNGHKLAYIKVPVYQFKVTRTDLQLINHSGFKQTIEYSDKFYAIRCWAEVLTNYGHDETSSDVFERKELSLALAGQTYDPTDPTVIFTPDENNKECLLEIPYIYFMEGRIRGTLHVDIYTTEGELNYQVPYNTAETCVIDMFSNISPDEDEEYAVTTYAEPFRSMPALNAFPMSSHIIGGSNGLSFEEIRNRVINGVETNVLQTPADIDAYFASYGYTATLYRDGITDRIFIVHATVRDDDNAVIGMDTIPTLFDFDRLDEYGTIVKAEDSESTYTILPSTLYKFDKGRKICVPLTDAERNELNNMSPVDKVNAFNNNVFTLSPFHLHINAASKYPTTLTYDMLQCKRLARTFVAARDDQYGLALNGVNLDVDKQVVNNRYRLTFRVSRVGFGTNIPVMETDEKGQAEKKIRVLVGLKNDDEQFNWTEAQWINTELGDDANSTNEVFELFLTPNYVFHQANNEHSVQMAFWDNPDFSDYLLTSECRVILLLRDGLNLSKSASGTSGGGVSVYQFEGDQCLETKFTSGTLVLPTGKRVAITSDVGLLSYYAMTEQKCIFQFGSPIDELDQRINLTYSEAVYKKHLTTKFRTLAEDKYKTDKDGNLDFKIEDGKVIMNVLYPKGTLTCMSITNNESLVPNKYTASNYLHCTALDGRGGKQEITEEILQEAVNKGTKMSIENAPLVPRFDIAGATDELSGCMGAYELTNAINAKPISSLENGWYKVGNLGDIDGMRQNIRVSANNALLFVIDNLVENNTRTSKPGDTDPLSSVEMEAGSFLLLKDDSSSPESIQLGTIGEDLDPDAPKVYTRLYYKFRNLTKDELAEDARTGKSSEKITWYCICQGKSVDTIRTFLINEAIEDEVHNPKLYGILYSIASITGDPSSTETPDEINKLYYVAFMTNMKYTARSDTYSRVPDTDSASASKQYFISPSPGIYRACTEDDFNVDGSFVAGVVYYERKLVEVVYEIPNFNYIEKSAWEAHEDQVEAITEEELHVVKGRRYFYKDKDHPERWVLVTVAMNEGDPVSSYIDLDETADHKIYYGKSYVTCTDKDYAWEQNANRWPWEVTNWKMVSDVLGTDESVKSTYLTVDDKLIIQSDWDRLHRYWEYSSDQVILDEHNHPLEDYEKNRSIQYLCDMLQMDAKLAQVTVQKEDTSMGSDFEDDGPLSRTYPNTVVKILRTYFDNIGSARASMFTNTRLFFEPVKSLGFADFNIGNGVIRTLPLDVSMKFRLHVTKDVYEDDVMLIQLKSQIVKIVDAQIDSGYVNCSEIANKIVETLNGSVKWVDVLGINGDTDLQTMKSNDESVRVHLAHRLKVLEDDMTIDSERALDIEAVVND